MNLFQDYAAVYTLLFAILAINLILAFPSDDLSAAESANPYHKGKYGGGGWGHGGGGWGHGGGGWGHRGGGWGHGGGGWGHGGGGWGHGGGGWGKKHWG